MHNILFKKSRSSRSFNQEHNFDYKFLGRVQITSFIISTI